MQWKSMVAFHNKAIQVLQSQVDDLKKTVRERDKQIANLKAEIRKYESMNKENEILHQNSRASKLEKQASLRNQY